MLKNLSLTTIILLASSVLAQETCESLITGLSKTLDQTQSIIQSSKMKFGFIELASFKTLTTQTPEGIEVSILERSGLERPEDESDDNGMTDQQQSLLGPLEVETINCENHSLKVLKENTYELEIQDTNNENPIQDYTLVLIANTNGVMLESMKARIKPPDQAFTVSMEASFSDWTLQD